MGVERGWRFWHSVDKSGECWIWTGPIDRYGYGHTTWGRGRHQKAHRVAWRLTFGEFPPADMTLDHLCRVRACVRPTHLEVVTRGENVRRGLLGGLSTHCKRGHPRSETNTYISRGARWCKPCVRAYSREWKARRRATARAAA